MKKKRLLFLLSRFLDGGIDTILVEYLNNIDFSRFEVTLAIGIDMGEREVFLPRVSPEVDVVHLVEGELLTRLPRRKLSGKPPFLEKAFDESVINPLRRMIVKRRLDRLVMSHDAVVDFDSSFYSKLRDCRKPVVGFYHFSIEENLRRSARHTRRQMAGMKGYAKIVVVSDAMLEEGRRLFPELSDKFVRIYNGYDLEGIVRRGSLAPEIKLPERYFVSVARLEESQKDNATLIRAYAEFRKRSGSSRLPSLVMAGTGKDSGMLSDLVKSLGLQDSVVMAGFVENPYPLMKHSIALILSSKYEGFGLVLVEAMALGKPVIASDCVSGPAEILENGKSGLLFPTGDIQALASCMEALATDDDMRTRLSDASLRRSKSFDIRESVNELMDILK